jgi:hypothetical protein
MPLSTIFQLYRGGNHNYTLTLHTINRNEKICYVIQYKCCIDFQVHISNNFDRQ